MVRTKKIIVSQESARAPLRVLHCMLYFLVREQVVCRKISFGRIPTHPYSESPRNQKASPDLGGIGLCLLKTQFAKKPKNPV